MVGAAKVLPGAEMIDLDELERWALHIKRLDSYEDLNYYGELRRYHAKQDFQKKFTIETCLRLVRAVKHADQIFEQYPLPIARKVLKDILEATDGD